MMLFSQLPIMDCRVVTETLVHGFWGMNTIDMTPGAGDLCLANVTNKIGYLGICQTEAQRDFIITRLKKEILKEVGKAGSLLYMPAYAKEHGAQEAKSEAEAKANTKKRPKLVAPAKVKEDEVEKGEKGAEKAMAGKAEAGKEDDGTQGPSKKSKKHEAKGCSRCLHWPRESPRNSPIWQCLKWFRRLAYSKSVMVICLVK